jgi:hypothetical protein
MIVESPKLWEKVYSVFKRMGHNYTGDFKEGGVQGLNGAADTLFHAKIVAYVHQIGLERKIICNAANTLTCIDDVLYNPNTTERDFLKRAKKITKLLNEVYDKLAYPLDPTKSIMGIMKYIFLNAAYSDKALVSSPGRIAIKADVDDNMLFRDIHTDVAAIMSTASSLAVEKVTLQ